MKLTVINDKEYFLEHDQMLPITQEDYNKLSQMNEFQVKQYLYTKVLHEINNLKFKDILENWLRDETISKKLN